MKENIEKLAESLVRVSEDLDSDPVALPNNLQEDFRYFLSLCDGGYTSDKFFHFFGRKGPRNHNITEWNKREWWKNCFGLEDSVFIFAEDILGTQFAFDIRGDRKVVKMFIPTTGKLTLCANSFQEFIEEMLNESATLPLRQLAMNFFKVRHQEFRPFTHISCRIPPVLGGDDSDINNLELRSAVANLRIIGQINEQVKSLPSGTRIRDIQINSETEEVLLVPEKQHWLKRLL